MKPSEYFADVMQKNHVIAVDEYELYQYSLNALFEMAGVMPKRQGLVLYCR